MQPLGTPLCLQESCEVTTVQVQEPIGGQGGGLGAPSGEEDEEGGAPPLGSGSNVVEVDGCRVEYSIIKNA